MMHKLLAAFLALFLMQAVCTAKDPPPVTDDTISDAVKVKLASDQLLGVLNFDVTVKHGVVTLGGTLEQKSFLVNVDHGVVTLTGTMQQKSLKSRAERLVKKVKGVKSVVN